LFCKSCCCNGICRPELTNQPFTNTPIFLSKLLTDLQYLPNITFWQQLAQHETVCLEQCENYIKGSPRNRCTIASSNGALLLSVPLQQGKNQQQGIREVLIANETAWQRQHWRSITSAYGSAPFWEHYAPYFEPFYTKKYDFLWDFNYDLFVLSLKLLKLETKIVLSETYEKTPDATIYTDIRHAKKATDTTIIIKTYPQVFAAKHGFLPNMSVLDGLFCVGKTVL
jgi:WbqC-like protein family